jgi:hypothetical protein
MVHELEPSETGKFYIYTFDNKRLTINEPATGWKTKGQSLSPGRIKNFLLSTSRLALGSTQSPIQWIPGPFSPGIKRPRRETDHSPPGSAEVKKMRVFTSTPSYAFMV